MWVSAPNPYRDIRCINVSGSPHPLHNHFSDFYHCRLVYTCSRTLNTNYTAYTLYVRLLPQHTVLEIYSSMFFYVDTFLTIQAHTYTHVDRRLCIQITHTHMTNVWCISHLKMPYGFWSHFVDACFKSTFK